MVLRQGSTMVWSGLWHWWDTSHSNSAGHPLPTPGHREQSIQKLREADKAMVAQRSTRVRVRITASQLCYLTLNFVIFQLGIMSNSIHTCPLPQDILSSRWEEFTVCYAHERGEYFCGQLGIRMDNWAGCLAPKSCLTSVRRWWERMARYVPSTDVCSQKALCSKLPTS